MYWATGNYRHNKMVKEKDDTGIVYIQAGTGALQEMQMMNCTQAIQYRKFTVQQELYVQASTGTVVQAQYRDSTFMLAHRMYIQAGTQNVHTGQQ